MNWEIPTIARIWIDELSTSSQDGWGIVWRNGDEKTMNTTRLFERQDPAFQRELTEEVRE
jgi:predicted glutamine amidotransferase